MLCFSFTMWIGGGSSAYDRLWYKEKFRDQSRLPRKYLETEVGACLRSYNIVTYGQAVCQQKDVLYICDVRVLVVQVHEVI